MGFSLNALGMNLENFFRACQIAGVHLKSQVQINEKKVHYGQHVCLKFASSLIASIASIHSKTFTTENKHWWRCKCPTFGPPRSQSW